MNDYWHKQSKAKPLFPDMEWSRPENKQLAGKLAVIGGNEHGFAAPAEAFAESMRAGVGLTRVLLPQAVNKLVKQLFLEVEFAPSNTSGSFSQKALTEWLDMALWADGVLLAGDLGRNSETAITFEKFVMKYSGQVTITKDAVEYALNTAAQSLNRPDTTFVLSMAQLQKLCIHAGSATPITFGMDLIRLVDTLHNLTSLQPINIVVKQDQTIVAASGGEVSTTTLAADMPTWRVKAAAHSAVWWLQNPSKPFQALSTAVHQLL